MKTFKTSILILTAISLFFLFGCDKNPASPEEQTDELSDAEKMLIVAAEVSKTNGGLMADLEMAKILGLPDLKFEIWVTAQHPNLIAAEVFGKPALVVGQRFVDRTHLASARLTQNGSHSTRQQNGSWAHTSASHSGSVQPGVPWGTSQLPQSWRLARWAGGASAAARSWLSPRRVAVALPRSS